MKKLVIVLLMGLSSVCVAETKLGETDVIYCGVNFQNDYTLMCLLAITDKQRQVVRIESILRAGYVAALTYEGIGDGSSIVFAKKGLLK